MTNKNVEKEGKKLVKKPVADEDDDDVDNTKENVIDTKNIDNDNDANDTDDDDDTDDTDDEDDETSESKTGARRSSSKSWEVKKKRVFLYGFRRTLISVGFKEDITGIEGKREVYTLTSPDGKHKIVGYLKQNRIDLDGMSYTL